VPAGPAHPLSRTYGADLRRLVNRAFGPAVPIPAQPLPGGTIAMRVKALTDADAYAYGMMAHYRPRPAERIIDGTMQLPLHRYWCRALAHRVLVLGPLVELASADIGATERQVAERRLLSVYTRHYRGVPLPLEVLSALREQTIAAPAEGLARWLDAALHQLSAADSVEAAHLARTELRRDAIMHGATGEWAERSVSLAELMTDILLICRAARDDVDRARMRAAQHGGSVALALAAECDANGTVFEAALPALIRQPFGLESVAPHDRARVLDFAWRRPASAPALLFAGASPEPPQQDLGAPSRTATDTGSKAQHTETAREAYLRLADDLQRRIAGSHNRPLIKQLALVGLGSIVGLQGQRVLITGATGAGKTHAAISLAKALGHPYTQADASDLTATGWHGADIASVLDALVLRMGDTNKPGVLILDEIDKVRALAEATGNSLEAKINLQHSLLGLLAGQPVTLQSGSSQIETAGLLIIGTGAFNGQFTRPPTTDDLVRWGWVPEFAARWGERFSMPSPDRQQAMELLRSGGLSVEQRIAPLATALGLHIEVPDSVLAYAADLWIRTASDYRTASEWLVSAARHRLVRALDRGEEGPIVIVPDDLRVSLSTREQDDPGEGPWDHGGDGQWART
jgi:hypothetical protein